MKRLNKLLKRVTIGALITGLALSAPAITFLGDTERVEAATASTSSNYPTRIALNASYDGTLTGNNAFYFVFKTDDVKSDYILYLYNQVTSSQNVSFAVWDRTTGQRFNLKTIKGLDLRTLPGGTHTCALRKEDLKPNRDYVIQIKSASSYFGNNYRYSIMVLHNMIGRNVSPDANGKFVLYNNGRLDTSYTGVARSTTGNWVFVRKGKYDTSFTGVAQSTTGNWVFVRKGRYDTSYTGVARSTTGNWVFVRNGRFSPSYTGVARSTTGNWVYVKNGRFSPGYTGLARSTTGNIVYVKNGRYYTGYNGKATFNGRTYTVKNGRAQ